MERRDARRQISSILSRAFARFIGPFNSTLAVKAFDLRFSRQRSTCIMMYSHWRVGFRNAKESRYFYVKKLHVDISSFSFTKKILNNVINQWCEKTLEKIVCRQCYFPSWHLEFISSLSSRLVHLLQHTRESVAKLKNLSGLVALSSRSIGQHVH